MSSAARLLAVTLFVGILLGLSSPANATTYYVSKSGNDANACTQASPCLTIAHAYGMASAGDIVQVTAGTYAETVSASRSGASGSKITVRGEDGAGCPTTVDSDVNSRGFRPAPTVTMNGFNVSGSNQVFSCFKMAGAGTGFNVSSGASNVDITDNYIDGQGTGSPGVGVNFPSISQTRPSNIYVARNYITRTVYGFIISCKTCTFEDNEINNMVNDSSSDAGADLDYTRVFGDSITLRHNYMHGNNQPDCKGADCHMDCFQTWNIGNAGESATNITIDRNTCFNANEGIIARDTSSGTYGSYTSHYNWTVTNNVIGHSPFSDSRGMPWVALFEHVGNVVFENNTCLDAGLVGYLNGAQATAHRNNIHYFNGWQPYSPSVNSWNDGKILAADHNLLYDSGQNYSATSYPNDTLNVDPKFMSPTTNATATAEGDWRLSSTSPAKDTGATISAVNVDHNSVSRPQGTGFDIGAYEFASGGTQAVQPPTNVQAVVH
jgi:hypothetical protein